MTFLESAITTNGVDSDKLLRIKAMQQLRMDKFENHIKKEEPEEAVTEQQHGPLDDLSASMICRLRSAFEN
jgi:hypothetical protein